MLKYEIADIHKAIQILLKKILFLETWKLHRHSILSQLNPVLWKCPYDIFWSSWYEFIFILSKGDTLILQNTLEGTQRLIDRRRTGPIPCCEQSTFSSYSPLMDTDRRSYSSKYILKRSLGRCIDLSCRTSCNDDWTWGMLTATFLASSNTTK
jgi:hypothetical protein